MKILDVFDAPMCCSTGICGEDVDSNLVQFAADIGWVRSRGVTVRRFNLSHDPQAFMNEPEVLKVVSYEGTQCLPLLVLDGKVVRSRTYPTRDQLAVLTGVATVATDGEYAARVHNLGSADVAPAKAGCCTPAKGGKAGCCS